MVPHLSGVIPILPTAFTPDGAIDDEGLANVIEAAISSGVNGVAMFGLASEYYKLSDAERNHLTTFVIRRVGKRCPVVISVVSHATRLAVAEAIRAVEAGADAIMILPPFFAAPPLGGVIQHIRDVAAAVKVPVIVQYAPLQTGRAIDMQVFAQLGRDQKNISHIKVDLVPSGPTISDLCANQMQSLVGYMGLHFPEDFVCGVGGVMPTVSVSSAFTRLWQMLSAKDERARSLHQRMLPLLNFMMQSIEFLIVCEKELLVQRGILRSAYCREPACTLDSFQRAELHTHESHLTEWLTRNLVISTLPVRHLRRNTAP